MGPLFVKVFVGFTLGIVTGSSTADCIDDAASYQQVNQYVLRAIAFQESSMRSWIVNRNSNGSIDIGLLGMNSVHFNDLAKFGIGPSNLTDPCLSAYVGAWMYRKKIQKLVTLGMPLALTILRPLWKCQSTQRESSKSSIAGLAGC